MQKALLGMALLLYLNTPSAGSAQDYPIPQEDQEKRKQPIRIQHPAGPPLVGEVKEVNLMTGQIVFEDRRPLDIIPKRTIIFLSKDTRLGSKYGKVLTLGDLLEPGSILSVEYYYSINGDKRIALEISKVESAGLK